MDLRVFPIADCAARPINAFDLQSEQFNQTATIEMSEDQPKKRKRSNPNLILHNRMAAIVAKTPGFGKFKNKRERREFAEKIMAGYGEEITHKRYHGVIETMECLYLFGILPRKVNELIDSYDGSTKAVAKLLGHTELRIRRALDCVVNENIQAILDDTTPWVRQPTGSNTSRDKQEGIKVSYKLAPDVVSFLRSSGRPAPDLINEAIRNYYMKVCETKSPPSDN